MAPVDSRIERILAAGARAPSVLNTQPWATRTTPDTIEVRADMSRHLGHVDPHARELFISLGAFVHNVEVAARRESLRPDVRLLPDPTEPLLAAVVHLHPAPPPSVDELERCVAIGLRATSRDPFDDQPLDGDVLRDIQAATRDQGAELVPLAGLSSQRDTLLDLVRRAEGIAAEDAAGVAEERAWVAVAPDRDDGIPPAALGPRPADPHAPVRDFVHPGSDTAEFEHRSTLAVLTTPADERRDWLVAGRALEAALLTATLFYVQASFLTNVLENPTTRHDLRRDLRLQAVPQMVLRLGHGRRERHTRRRRAALP